MNLKEIESEIREYAPNAVMEVIYIEKLQKSLLFVSIKPSINSLKVYDELNGLDDIAEIRYSMGNESVYISSFRVDEDYQLKGLGRMIFEYVMAHADAMGATRLSGTADPTDPIKGVSTGEDEDYEKEVEAIKKIYKKLGCTFIDDKHFIQKWKPKDKLSKVNPQFRKMIDEMVKREVSVM